MLFKIWSYFDVTYDTVFKIQLNVINIPWSNLRCYLMLFKIWSYFDVT